jgi:hypothetical protein
MTAPAPDDIHYTGSMSVIERTARRNSWLAWLLDQIRVAEEHVNWLSYYSARSPLRLTDLQAADAMAAAAKLRAMADDLEAVAARRKPELTAIQNAA